MVTSTYRGSAFLLGLSSSTLNMSAYNQSAGQAIVVLTNTYEGAGSSSLSTITDTAGNTYTPQLSGQGFTSGNNVYVQAWVAKNCLGNASNVITATYAGGATFVTMAAYSVSGADLTSPVDVKVTNSGSSTAAASASYTTATANESLLFLTGSESGFIKVDSVDSSFNLDDGEIGGAGTGLSGVASLDVSMTQVAQVVTATLHASNAWNTLLVSIKEPTASTARPVLIIVQ